MNGSGDMFGAGQLFLPQVPPMPARIHALSVLQRKCKSTRLLFRA